MGVLEDGFKEATKGLDFAKRRDRVRGFYVRRRAQQLVQQNPSIDALDLAVRLAGEQAEIFGFITKKTKDLLVGPDAASPAHLDLADVSKITVFSVGLFNTFHRAAESRYRNNRATWIWEVVWRAMAIHSDELWKSLTPPRELETEALTELLDRRLRAVELMTCIVNSGGYRLGTGGRRWSVAGPSGPWKDNIRVRTVEYPFLPKKDFEPHLLQMPEWRSVGDMILFAPSNAAPIHFPKAIATSWKAAVTKGGTIWVNYSPSETVKPADVLRKLFEIPREDFLERSWLFCDMVGAAVNIEALWVGRRRRSLADTSVADALNKEEGYASLGPVLQFDGPRDLDTLMADGDDDLFFENTEIDFNDLQVGDFVLFWNSRVYRLLTHGAWGNEFSHVMGVDSDPTTGEIRVTGGGAQVWLAGHGLHTTLYNSMASELTKHIGNLLDSSRRRITDALATRPNAQSIAGGKFVKWVPYEDFDAPGPWWLSVPKGEWKDQWAYASLQEVLKAVPRTIANTLGGGAGYQLPPDTEAVYFPLYEPRVGQTGTDGDSWRAYLRKRKADASFRAPSKLSALQVDGRLAVGLFYRGKQAKIPVVRPRVTK